MHHKVKRIVTIIIILITFAGSFMSFVTEKKGLKPVRIIEFSEMGLENFTCTGLAYDQTNDFFWVADFGRLTQDGVSHPRLVALDRDFSHVCCVIALDDVIGVDACLQGIAYDAVDRCLWLAVGDGLHEVNQDGEMMRTIGFPEYPDVRTNGICYDEMDDSLWVLFNKNYLLHTDKDGAVSATYMLNLPDQDMICLYDGLIYITDGSDYRGQNNYLHVFDTKKGKLNCVSGYRLIDSYAVEGCYMDGKRLLVLNDGLYHDASHRSSYLAVYEVQDMKW